MRRALDAAEAAFHAGEVPVGAVIVGGDGAIIATAYNQVETQQNPLAHAEMLVITEALALRGAKYLEDCTIYVTLEPCPLCAQAIAAVRIKSLHFSAYDPKSGGVEHGPCIFAHSHHRPEVVGGVGEAEAAGLLKRFFEAKR